MRPDAPELDYLTWMMQNIDFGPAHEDVMLGLNEAFEAETGQRVPEAWRDEVDE